ncbi:hypothetical protein IAT40_006343 [Kwoniella sp. CBS 6097]
MTNTLFQLEPLSLGSLGSPLNASPNKKKKNSSGLEQLAADTAPRFFLPKLDEHISGNERLLASLRGSSSYRLQDLPAAETKTASFSAAAFTSRSAGHLTPTPTKDKGKGKAVEVEDGNERYQTPGVWAQAYEECEAGPSRKAFEPIKTWDVVDASRFDPSEKTPFLSEKPVFLFEALLTANEPSIQLPKLRHTSPMPVQDPKTLLELMMHATLGTTTTEHLKWDKKQTRYLWGIEGGRPMGMEGVTAISAYRTFLDIGTAIRRLEIIIDDQSALPLTPTHHALFHAVSTYVTFIKQRLTSAVEECSEENSAGWNSWIAATKDVGELTEALCDVMGWPLTGSTALALPSRSSALLSHLYAHLLAAFSTSSTTARGTSPTTLALAYLLSNSSGPVLTLLNAWIGLGDSSTQDDDNEAASQPWTDLGITRQRLNTSEGGWDYTFSSKRMPGFIPREDARTLFEAGRSLRLLRDASAGGHPLCATDWGIEARWTWGHESTHSHAGGMRSHVRRVQQEVEQWRRSTKDRTRPLSGSTSFGRLRVSHGHRRERKRIPMDLFQQEDTTPESPDVGRGISPSQEEQLDQLFALFNKPPGSHLASSVPSLSNLNKKTKPHLWAPTPLEALHAYINRHSHEPLLPPDLPTLPLFISQHLLSPLLAHSTLISTSLVSLYLDDLRFLDHLDILHSFWLGADVDFIERVSSALFGKEAGAGEALGLGRRARTRARLGLGLGQHNEDNDHPRGGADLPEGEWGIGLGLGLSERAKWPPGGSELAYALRTTLLDDKLQEQVANKGPVWEEVEDRVSFAIKQLPEDDASGRRAKWMDPQAIEALDFLYLSYSPPASIAVLLPRPLLEKYQSINNLLLRLARCEVVLRSMYWPILHHTDLPTGDAVYKTGVDSKLNRASVKAKASLQRSRERQLLALFPEYSVSEKRVRVLRMKMAHLVSALGRYMVDTAIGIKWVTMRKRLERLKRRASVQEEVQSRPSSPSTESKADFIDTHSQDDLDDVHIDIEDRSDSEAEEEGQGSGGSNNLANVHQLQSIHSLVLYHNLTLDKILRACLLGPSAGQQVTSKIMMRLLGLVLDLGKVLVEVERGGKGWEEGAEVVQDLEREWDEKERVFLHALERLSLRTSSQDDIAGGGGDGHDLKMLISGEDASSAVVNGGDVQRTRKGVAKECNDLQELLLRLSLGRRDPKANIRNGGRYRAEEI